MGLFNSIEIARPASSPSLGSVIAVRGLKGKKAQSSSPKVSVAFFNSRSVTHSDVSFGGNTVCNIREHVIEDHGILIVKLKEKR